MVMCISMLKTSKAQTFNANLSAVLQFKLDSLVNEFSGNTKGVSIGVYCPGQGYWNGVSGISHPGVNITPDMKYGIASNTKLFIAVTMLRLDEDQIIDIDNPISTWLPAIPNVNPAITVRQLLNHTSGVSDPFFTTALLDTINAHPLHIFTNPEVLAWLGAPSFPVGTSYAYSNYNYILAGMIAEMASGVTMAQLVRNYILTPLSLNNTFYDFTEAEIAPLAHRWKNGVDYFNISRISLNSSSGPAGALFSNGSDMAHWYHSLMDGQILTQASFDELTSFISFGALGNYGLGLQKSMFFGRETWGHGGSTIGYKSRSVYDPCNKYVVCGLANSDWAAIDGITLTLYKAILDKIPDCSAPINGLSTVCQGDLGITFTVPAINHATSYEWTLPNGVIGNSITNSITVDFSLAAVSGKITVKGLNMYGEGTPTSFAIVVNPMPVTPIISYNGNALHSDAPIGNQWYDQNGVLIGEINQDFNFTITADYYTIVSLNGCVSNPSNIINTFDAGVAESNLNHMLDVFPNPTEGVLNIELNGNTNDLSYSIINIINQEVMKGEFKENITLNINQLEKGVYIILIENSNSKYSKRILKI